MNFTSIIKTATRGYLTRPGNMRLNKVQLSGNLVAEPTFFEYSREAPQTEGGNNNNYSGVWTFRIAHNLSVGAARGMERPPIFIDAKYLGNPDTVDITCFAKGTPVFVDGSLTMFTSNKLADVAGGKPMQIMQIKANSIHAMSKKTATSHNTMENDRELDAFN